MTRWAALFEEIQVGGMKGGALSEHTGDSLGWNYSKIISMSQPDKNEVKEKEGRREEMVNIKKQIEHKQLNTYDKIKEIKI